MPRFLASLAGTTWRLLSWVVVLALLAAIAAALFYWFYLEDEIRSRVQSRLAEHYEPLGLDVTVGRARLVETEGLQIRGLRVTESAAKGPAARLLDVEEIFLAGRLDPRKLIQGEWRVSRITLTRPVLRATQRDDGTWSVASLLPLPRMAASQAPPVIQIVDGAIELFNPENRGPPLVLRGLRLTLRPMPQQGAPAGQTVYRLEGELAGGVLRRAQLQGEVAPQGGRWSLGGLVEGIQLNAQLLAQLPIELPEQLAELDGLQGQVGVRFVVTHDPAATPALQFRVASELTQGRLDNARLPQPLTDMSATLAADETGMAIERLTAHCGPAVLHLSGSKQGYDPEGPARIDLQVRNLVLDPKWAELAGEQTAAQWPKYLPAGQIDADLNARFDGQRWSTTALVNFLNVSFTHYRFTYRLKQATGSLRLEDDVLSIDLLAYAGAQPVRIVGQWTRPGPRATGWTEVRVDGVPFDETLQAAMTQRQAEVVRSFQPRGTFNVHGRFEKTDPHSPLFDYQIAIALNGCSIRYEKFPYLFEEVRGTLVLAGGHWAFRDLESQAVRGHGRWTPTDDGGRLEMFFTAHDVPLSEPLRAALPADVQRVWDSLRPRGAIDRLDAEVRYDAGSKQLNLDLAARKWPEPANERNRAVSIDPVFFSYRFDNLHGAVHYRDGRITWERMKGEHGRTVWTASGTGQTDADGGWQVRLDDVAVDRLPLDRDLLDALPPRVTKSINELNLAGPVDLAGAFDFQQRNLALPPAVWWDVTIGLHEASINPGIRLENIHGPVRLVGHQDPHGRYRCLGQFDFDAVTYEGFQFTQVSGPFEVLPNQLLLGSRAARIGDRVTPVPVKAKIFGGTVVGDAVVMFGDRTEFWLQAQLTGADLKRLALETMPGQQRLSGRLVASTQLWGTTQGRHTLRGEGKIRLRDADVYELPAMVALLKVLSVRAPDSTAFTASDMDYRIEGDHVYFDRINVSGDAISLLGKGEMDFDRKVNLNFYAVVGRDELRLPVLRPLLGEASRQMMQIRVEGPLENPRITQEAFPGAKQFLQQVQDDLRRAEPQDVLQPAREVLRRSGLMR